MGHSWTTMIGLVVQTTATWQPDNQVSWRQFLHSLWDWHHSPPQFFRAQGVSRAWFYTLYVHLQIPSYPLHVRRFCYILLVMVQSRIGFLKGLLRISASWLPIWSLTASVARVWPNRSLDIKWMQSTQVGINIVVPYVQENTMDRMGFSSRWEQMASSMTGLWLVIWGQRQRVMIWTMPGFASMRCAPYSCRANKSDTAT